MDAPLNFFEILRTLCRHEVEFILVGGVAAILEGAPVSTLDLDVVILKSEENLTRLLPALLELDAHYLDLAGRHLVPDAEKLATFKLHRLVTSSGPLDVMTTIGHGLSYADLIGDTRIFESEGLQVRVLGLETIIRSKEQANRDKDRATLHLLHRTLLMRQRFSAEE
jgi:hypothetical protein